ncbi:hypothetical protein O6H91_04G052700 [Diphasiastrum complanatum]|uniref:Uncharacterized protein n=1 Tax=Diphasiastrum complanatum TaxID=34168 RepID=A0ACC2DWS5_DIPCM|nr:hypothetical protein O6H91_04G052700 [Diphasiastrum complanatum]
MSREDDMWRRNSTPFSRIVNPELYAKPNPKIAMLGTTMFIAITASLLWQKYTYEKQKGANRNQVNNSKSTETVFTDDATS